MHSDVRIALWKPVHRYRPAFTSGARRACRDPVKDRSTLDRRHQSESSGSSKCRALCRSTCHPTCCLARVIRRGCRPHHDSARLRPSRRATSVDNNDQSAGARRASCPAVPLKARARPVRWTRALLSRSSQRQSRLQCTYSNGGITEPRQLRRRRHSAVIDPVRLPAVRQRLEIIAPDYHGFWYDLIGWIARKGAKLSLQRKPAPATMRPNTARQAKDSSRVCFRLLRSRAERQ